MHKYTDAEIQFLTNIYQFLQLCRKHDPKFAQAQKADDPNLVNFSNSGNLSVGFNSREDTRPHIADARNQAVNYAEARASGRTPHSFDASSSDETSVRASSIDWIKRSGMRMRGGGCQLKRLK